MATVVGAVYKFKQQIFHDYWKKYFLTLNEENGRISYVKKDGELKGSANLKKIFLAIYCRQLQPLDQRLAKARLKFAPYALVIPMFDKNSGKVEHEEFALGSLDELETWLRKFAECAGALERFKIAETKQQAQGQECRGPKKAEWEAPTSVLKIEIGPKQPFGQRRFNVVNRWDYEPGYFPLVWEMFLMDEQREHCKDYGDCRFGDCSDAAAVGGDWHTSAPTFSFTGVTIIDPGTGVVADTTSWSAPDDSSSFWSSFFADPGTTWEGGGGGGSDGGRGHSYSDGGTWEGADGNGGGCDFGGGTSDSGGNNDGGNDSGGGCDVGGGDSGGGDCGGGDGGGGDGGGGGGD